MVRRMRAVRMMALSGFTIVSIVLGCGSGHAEPVGGDWHGAIEIPGQPLDIAVHVTGVDAATIDIPAQGVQGLALEDVVFEAERVEFAIPDVAGDPVYHGTRHGDRVDGEFTQSGQAFPLHLQQGPLEISRPQEPQPPLPYRSEDVAYRNGDINIAGTLTAPEGEGPFPAVLLITGSGAQDRNEELRTHRPFLVLADTLTRAGYAVLRTDDRGVGGTGGQNAQATYEDMVTDVEAGVGFLGDRDDIDTERVGLLGHSEGGYLAPVVAAKPDSGVAFTMLMSGPAVSGGDVLIEQNRMLYESAGASPEEVDRQTAFTTEFVALVRSGDLAAADELSRKHNESLPPEQRAPDGQLADMLTPSMVSLINYDPAPALSAARVPVLAFFGGKDVQVPATQNEQPMRDLLAGNPDATVRTFDGLNHLMQPANTGLPGEYATIETTIDPGVLDYVTGWLDERFAAT